MFKSEVVQQEWELLLTTFPTLTLHQRQQFAEAWDLYTYWNERINLISRKDVEHLYKHHILHSLSIAWKTRFSQRMVVIDVGTGGGFPGIPLAIMFPTCQFILVDSIAKKIHAVQDIAKQLQLSNVEALCSRVEQLDITVNLVVARAVAKIPELLTWTKKLVLLSDIQVPSYALLKGEDVVHELVKLTRAYQLYSLKDFVADTFFASKMLVHIF